MAFQAQGNIVIIKLSHEDTVLDSGIVVPGFRGVPDFGEVISVGPGKIYDNGTVVPTGIEVGQTVKFDKLYAHGVFIEEVEYVYVPADNVLCIMEDD